MIAGNFATNEWIELLRDWDRALFILAVLVILMLEERGRHR